MERTSRLVPLVTALALLACFGVANAAGGECYGPWLTCVKRPACRTQMAKLAACTSPVGLLAGYAGQCVQNAFNASEPVPELLSLTSCAQRLSGLGWVLLDTTIDVPGVTPDKIWPLYRDLTLYSRWTRMVAATCKSKGCDPTNPLPGDLLDARVQIFPDASPPPPRAPIPLAQVTEVRDGTTCVGLPGRCTSPADAPPYRISWGPTYILGPIEFWGYEHSFDLTPIKDSNNIVTGTTIRHHEYYKGLFAPLVMSDRYGFKVRSLLAVTVNRQNRDMKAFALANLVC